MSSQPRENAVTKRSSIALAAVFFGLALAANAAPIQYRLPRETAGLKPGAGMELTAAQCGLCHSVDYISTQPPARGVAFWQASVTKMIRVYGAEVPEAQAAEIAAYLAANY